MTRGSGETPDWEGLRARLAVIPHAASVEEY